MKFVILLLLLIISIHIVRAQTGFTIPDSTTLLIASKKDTINHHQFHFTHLIVPTSLVTLGIIGMTSDWMESRNVDVRNEFQRINQHTHLDDYAQYAPMASVYMLNLCGVKGKHNFRDRTLILATASVLNAAIVNTLKNSTHIQRPDKSTHNSFPSGHTATAFMGAEFLRKEYKDVTPWIGIAGYTVALSTGFSRMYNNRHWFNDVAAGAGIGIFSTRAAYWLTPFLQKKLFGRYDRKKEAATQSIVAAPIISKESNGISLVMTW